MSESSWLAERNYASRKMDSQHGIISSRQPIQQQQYQQYTSMPGSFQPSQCSQYSSRIDENSQLPYREQLPDGVKSSIGTSVNRKEYNTSEAINHINQNYEKYFKHGNLQSGRWNSEVQHKDKDISMENSKQSGNNFSSFRYELEAEEFRSKRRIIERETQRMEEELKFMKERMLSEMYLQKQHEDGLIFRLGSILENMQNKNQSQYKKESFIKLWDLCFGAEELAYKFRETSQRKLLKQLFEQWNRQTKGALKLNQRNKNILIDRAQERESKSYYLDKLRSKVLLGWIDYFRKNKELLSIKKKRVNIHAIFGNSRDVSPMKQEYASLTKERTPPSSSCKVCQVLDKRNSGLSCNHLQSSYAKYSDTKDFKNTSTTATSTLHKRKLSFAEEPNKQIKETSSTSVSGWHSRFQFVMDKAQEKITQFQQSKGQLGSSKNNIKPKTVPDNSPTAAATYNHNNMQLFTLNTQQDNEQFSSNQDCIADPIQSPKFNQTQDQNILTNKPYYEGDQFYDNGSQTSSNNREFIRSGSSSSKGVRNTVGLLKKRSLSIACQNKPSPLSQLSGNSSFIVTPSSKCNNILERRSTSQNFFKDTRSSSLKKRNDFSASQKRRNSNLSGQKQGPTGIFSFFHATESKHIRGSSNSKLLSPQLDEVQQIEDASNEYNPINFESSLRNDLPISLNLSCIQANYSSTQSKVSCQEGQAKPREKMQNLEKKNADQNIQLINQRAEDRKKTLEKLKFKQLEWKKRREDELKQKQELEEAKQLEERQRFLAYGKMLKKQLKNSKLSAEEQREREQQNLMKAQQLRDSVRQRKAFKILSENITKKGMLEKACRFQFKRLLKLGFQGFSRQITADQQHYLISLKKKAMSALNQFVEDSNNAKEEMKKQKNEILMRKAFQALYSEQQSKKKDGFYINVVDQFRKFVLQLRGFKGWKQQLEQRKNNRQSLKM